MRTLGSWTSMRAIWIAWMPWLVRAVPFSQVMPDDSVTIDGRA